LNPNKEIQISSYFRELLFVQCEYELEDKPQTEVCVMCIQQFIQFLFKGVEIFIYPLLIRFTTHWRNSGTSVFY